MKIPIQISPDRIKDAIVQTRYHSKVPFEVALGWFYKCIDDTYFYSNRPPGLKKNQINTLINEDNTQGIQIAFGHQYLFYNEKIKVELQPNTITFNCLNQYIGWELYFEEIKRFLGQILEAGVIEHFDRIGIRFISHYPAIDIRNCVKFSFTFGMPQVVSDTFGFNTSFEYEALRVILNLYNNIQVIDNHSNEIKPLSIIDVDVIDERFEVKNNALLELYARIDNVHNKEKEVFFNILKEEFLQTLNPIY
jgi:uncharacterized protein (TIGR04255 family)